MPWRLIQFIVFFGIFLIFIIFNVENRCDISFGFIVFRDVLVFITVFVSFIAGMLCAVPFILTAKSRSNQKTLRKEKTGKSDENASAGNGSYGID